MASPLEIAQKLEVAVKAVADKKAAYDASKKAVDDTEKAYRASLDAVQELHKAYQEYMSTVLYTFGQVHK